MTAADVESTARDRGHDMIVPLLALPESRSLVETARANNVVIRRAKSTERTTVCHFVEGLWPYWTDEVRSAFSFPPTRLFVATVDGEPVGFAAYDVNYRGLFGPTGVAPHMQNQGIGAALLVRTLEAMREAGYLYAIIGAVGPAGFYRKFSGALSLPLEWPNFTEVDRA